MQPITVPPLDANDTDAAGSQAALFEKYTNARDVNGLAQLASDAGADSLIGKASLKQLNTIQTNAAVLKSGINTIEDAGGVGSPKGNQKLAQAFVTTADNPLYGQALIAYTLGRKEDAYNLFTGGTNKTTIGHAKDNGNMLEVVTNGLGQLVSVYDNKDHRFLTKEEYTDRGGIESSLDKTIAGLNQLENRQLYNAAFQTEQASINNWNQAYASVDPKIQYINDWTSKHGSDLPPELYSKLIRTVAKNIGTASTSSISKTDLDQLQRNANTGDGVKVDNKIAAQTGAVIGQILKLVGDKLVSTDGKYSESIDNLKSKNSTKTTGSENSKSSSETLDSILKDERFQAAFKGKTDKEKQAYVQQLEQTLRFSNEVGMEIANTADKHGKPSFISLPTTASFNDPQALLMTQNAQHKYNAEQLAAYSKYFNKNAELYGKTNTLPVPGAIASAFINSTPYKTTRKNYATAIDAILNADHQAATPVVDKVPATAVSPVPLVAESIPAVVPVTSPAALADRTTAEGRAAAAAPAAPAATAAAAPPPVAAAAPPPAASTTPPEPPKPGAIITAPDGKKYKFKGGNPNNKANYQEVK